MKMPKGLTRDAGACMYEVGTVHYDDHSVSPLSLRITIV